MLKSASSRLSNTGGGRPPELRGYRAAAGPLAEHQLYGVPLVPREPRVGPAGGLPPLLGYMSSLVSGPAIPALEDRWGGMPDSSR